MRPHNKKWLFRFFWLANQKIMIVWINDIFQLFCSFEFNQKQQEQNMDAVLDAQR